MGLKTVSCGCAVVGVIISTLLPLYIVSISQPQSVVKLLWNAKGRELPYSYIGCLAKHPASALDRLRLCPHPSEKCDVQAPPEFRVADGAFYTRDVQVGDADGDGEADDIIHCERLGVPFYQLSPLAIWNKGNKIGGIITFFVRIFAKHFNVARKEDWKVAGRSTVYVHLNKRTDGRVWETFPVHTDTSFDKLPDCRALQLVDFDKDGDMDIVISGHATRDVIWYENELGDGIQWKTHNVVPEGNLKLAPESARAVDIDEDGDMDIIVSNGFKMMTDEDGTIYNNIMALENADGMGQRWIAHELASIPVPITINAADIDGNGKVDIAFASRPDGYGNEALGLGWLRNLGGHPFSQSSWQTKLLQDESTGHSHVFLLLADDMDLDGKVDLVGVSTESLEIYHQQENLAFSHQMIDQTSYESRSVLAGPKDVIIKDADGDNDPDILVASAFSRTIVWYESVGNSTNGNSKYVTHIISDCHTGISTVALGDMDHDGTLEVITGIMDWPGSVQYLNLSKPGSVELSTPQSLKQVFFK